MKYEMSEDLNVEHWPQDHPTWLYRSRIRPFAPSISFEEIVMGQLMTFSGRRNNYFFTNQKNNKKNMKNKSNKTYIINGTSFML